MYRQQWKRGGGGRGGGVGGSSKKPRPTGPQYSKPAGRTAVWAEAEPPNPIVAVGWDRSSPNSYRLGKLLYEECRLPNNWGMFNFWSDRDPPEFTNEHPATTEQDPQINTDPLTALRTVKSVMENSPLVSSFTIRSPSGESLELGYLETVEWLKAEDLRAPFTVSETNPQLMYGDMSDEQMMEDTDLSLRFEEKVRRKRRAASRPRLSIRSVCRRPTRNG